MPLLPSAGPPMPGMPTMPMGPQVQPSPMMDPGMGGPPGMAPPGMGPAGPGSPTQSVVLALLANQAQSDGTAAQIMGQGAAEMGQSAQQAQGAIQALVANMMTTPNPMAVGAQTEPAPAFGTGLPPDPNAPMGAPPMGGGAY